MVIKYGYTGDDFLCEACFYQKECDELCYGSVIKLFQKLDLWPGNPQDIADRMKSTNVETLWADLKETYSPIYPNISGYNRGSHTSCGWSNTLHPELDKVVSGRVAKVMEAKGGHFEQQLQKLENSKDGILDELQVSKDLSDFDELLDLAPPEAMEGLNDEE